MKNLLLLFILFSIFATSCEKQVTEITIPPHDPKITIGADLVVGSPIAVLTSSSLYSLTYNEPVLLTGAKVYLYENNAIVDTLTKDSALYFIGDYVIQAGKNYMVKVEHSSYKTASGSTQTPINNISISDLMVSLEVDSSYSYSKYRKGQISFTINQSTDQNQFYTFSISDEQNEVEKFVILSNDVIFTNDAGGTNECLNSLETTSEQIGESAKVTLHINTQECYSNENDFTDDLVLKINILNNDKKKYKDSFEKYQISEDDPFSEAVLLYNNIENGYGIVMGEYTEEILLKP